MGLVWNEAESEAFQNQLKTNISVWENALSTWKSAIDSATSTIGTDLKSEAVMAIATLFRDRILTIVDTGQRACTWTKEHLTTYATAEAQLSELGKYFEEDALQVASDKLNEDLVYWDTFAQANGPWGGDLYLKKLRLAQDTQKQLDTLRYFSASVSSLFSEEFSLRGTLSAAIDSVRKGTMSQGVYTPGDDESWMQTLNNYLAYHAATTDPAAIAGMMRQRLIDEGLLSENPPDDWPHKNPDGSPDWPGDLYEDWLENAARHHVSIDEIVKIASEQGISPESFEVLRSFAYQVDPDGKRFYIIPTSTTPADAMNVVLMTYIFNAGTDYATADDASNRNKQNSGDGKNDFAETPYSSTEIERIKERQQNNAWSYEWISDTGAVMATPNGMLMGVGGSGARKFESQSGGTTYGDIFLLNLDDTPDPNLTLINTVKHGTAPLDNDLLAEGTSDRDLDRLLHHEEQHSQQWSAIGKTFGPAYLLEAAGKIGQGEYISWEQYAGLSDGGYA